jgi:hypothetical protein
MANHEGNGNNLIFQAKFNGTRFSQWKFGALIMARAKKLVGIIEGTEQKPVEVTKLLLVFFKNLWQTCYK